MKKYEQYWDEESQSFIWDGCNYDHFDDLIQSKLGFCGCGCPDDAQQMIMKALRHVANLQDLVWEDKITWEEWNKSGRELFGAWEYVIYYMLDEKKLTEHGGSVPGWLTARWAVACEAPAVRAISVGFRRNCIQQCIKCIVSLRP